MYNNFNRLSDFYASGFQVILKQRFSDWALDSNRTEYKDFFDYKENLYFLTIRLSYRLKSNSTENIVEAAFKEFSGFYHKLCMSIVPGSYQRKKQIQPLTLVSIDSDGSRGFVPRNEPIQGAHLHAVLLVHPAQIEDFEKFSEPAHLQFLAGRWKNIESIDIRKFDIASGTLENLIAYILKHNAKAGEDHYRIYPL